MQTLICRSFDSTYFNRIDYLMLGSAQNARLVIFHNGRSSGPRTEHNQLLRLAVSGEIFADMIFPFSKRQVDHIKRYQRLPRYFRPKIDLIAMPDDWLCPVCENSSNVVFYQQDLLLSEGIIDRWKKSRWLIVSNGRFVTKVKNEWLFRLLHNCGADIVAVKVEPKLQAGNDKVLFTRENKIVGFRRYYENMAETASVCDDWPHLVFIKTDVLDKLIISNTFPLSFPSFTDNCCLNRLVFRSIKIAGELLDLDSRQGLLNYLENFIYPSKNHISRYSDFHNNNLCEDGAKIARGVRLIGKVLLGRKVTVEQDAVIIGPTLICDNTTIAKGSLIRASIIGPGVCIEPEQTVDSCVIMDKDFKSVRPSGKTSIISGTNSDKLTAVFKSGGNNSHTQANKYRIWPTFSYAGCFKRLADVFAAIMVLILFAPVLPIIALVVKLTSPGPVLFKDRRQGLHGKVFNCIKFRTMMTGAEKIQDKLRVVSQVDGPQFKIDDDPRVNNVGRFLRDTYIDEIPQFFNVLMGQMSVVGPRPSPEAENTMCAYWRDARLSVRPGITGLWQICRTRQEMKDFQEWIHYDTKYTREVSFRLDVWIGWQTFKKMVMNFARLF